ncbi:MAG: imidazole glycerol phosphate synthase subunit HisH [Ferrovum sp. 37-45-19]|uniref:imidazole glycerol phosphate synthase subunit HisH n=1 Tax=Ferrovum sp. JA12 TaxID=1356299 RepID=UPI0007039183|nr:imidazole glycerol phosphate synthase subunit HisH [Ferrovum sp. JA12]OYV79624.1 MAG: imidazole glycerol phosphate synthase subunit HisH [Ferrovum sp. 21-44-67]OYV94581.1 MAG: imidazole glycerol phosphate synthase subunit HisH [Ferrovum sp. 37-45-19]OZB34591.1 MAG: imidazole glycerol phosphate synthase subunit HisH [Ferrovum sp. 34-44-207]HQT81550.1 imidazole glycerol phosphate synthase subunit HisH [Ferrovaceae bacterium]KRH79522.1 imidazole glycerol phosphate synthase subunit HisH 1 [Ferr
MSEIVIIDYGMGNLRSVEKALQRVAPLQSIKVTSDPDLIKVAERVVFPGQGAMPDCMRELKRLNLIDVLMEAAKNKPFLGICLGLQMLFEFSEEGDSFALGFFKGEVKRFSETQLFDKEGNRLKVPHMGWNQVEQSTFHPLWKSIPNYSRFYFVHSYYVREKEPIVCGLTHYPDAFTSAVARDNLFAVQFHPEKSATAGLTLLENFVQWKP